MTKLREVAHSRTGDKGNISNISLIAYRIEMYPLLRKGPPHPPLFQGGVRRPSQALSKG